jgi:hypothetical protein
MLLGGGHGLALAHWVACAGAASGPLSSVSRVGDQSRRSARPHATSTSLRLDSRRVRPFVGILAVGNFLTAGTLRPCRGRLERAQLASLMWVVKKFVSTLSAANPLPPLGSGRGLGEAEAWRSGNGKATVRGDDLRQGRSWATT